MDDKQFKRVWDHEPWRTLAKKLAASRTKSRDDRPDLEIEGWLRVSQAGSTEEYDVRGAMQLGVNAEYMRLWRQWDKDNRVIKRLEEFLEFFLDE